MREEFGWEEDSGNRWKRRMPRHSVCIWLTFTFTANVPNLTYCRSQPVSISAQRSFTIGLSIKNAPNPSPLLCALFPLSPVCTSSTASHNSGKKVSSVLFTCSVSLSTTLSSSPFPNCTRSTLCVYPDPLTKIPKPATSVPPVIIIPQLRDMMERSSAWVGFPKVASLWRRAARCFKCAVAAQTKPSQLSSTLVKFSYNSRRLVNISTKARQQAAFIVTY
jgi:hypothetical protein